MNPSTTFLLALKGTCALNCLAALHLAGPLPVTQRTVMDLTGFDDAAVSKGLATLRVLGLAVCTGDERRTAWQLADAGQRPPLPLDPILPSPENLDSDALIKEEEEKEREQETQLFNHLDSLSIVEAPNPQNLDSGAGQPPAAGEPGAPVDKPANAAQSVAPPAGRQVLGSRLRGDAAGHARRRAERALRARFYAAFEAASIFLQFRRPLADALLAAEDGPAWLRQTLGWLCYAERRLPHVQRGAVVYICLRDRLPCHPAYLPPPGLLFEAALAWALRGGEDEREPAELEDDDDVDDQTPRVCAKPTLGVSDGAPRVEQELWQTLIARLSRELSPALIDSQLRPARLLSLGAERALIGVPTAQSRDWLRTRLAVVLARALAELTGRALAVEIVVDS